MHCIMCCTRNSHSATVSVALAFSGYFYSQRHFHSPTITDTLRCLTDTYRGQGRLEDAAEVEMLSKEKNFDQAHKDRIKQLLRDEKLSEKNLTEKLLAKRSNSPISSKTQVRIFNLHEVILKVLLFV